MGETKQDQRQLIGKDDYPGFTGTPRPVIDEVLLMTPRPAFWMFIGAILIVVVALILRVLGVF